ncbi:unnamed protein product [Camellia sinensis]
MDPQEVMNLYDSYWFTLEIFKNPPQKSSSETNPDQQNQENKQEPELSIPSLQSIHVRSKSDQLSSMTSFDSDFLSPNSVLFTPNLQTILSGKETTYEEPTTQLHVEEQQHQSMRSTSIRRKTNKGMTKSLSDLEFEELKGFMDLGFVFSEEDVNSSLVEIIPGLQRLAKKDGEKAESQKNSFDESSTPIPRPYLSEAWEVLDRRNREMKNKKNNPLINWRVPDLGNEINMKDSLKWWAQTVASTVR